MEEEIEVVLNVTESAQNYEPSLNSTILNWWFVIASVLALLSDILIITTILRLRRLQIKRNLILLHWAAMDIGFLSTTPKLSDPIMSLLTKIQMSSFARCAVSNIDSILLFAELLLAITFLSNLMKSKTITVDTLLKVVYGIVVVLVVIAVGLCAASIIKYFPIHFVIVFMFAFMVLQVIVKEINKFRKRKTAAFSKSAIIQINIGRAYVYNILIAVFFIYLSNARFSPVALREVAKYFSITVILGSFYIVLCLVKIDEGFKSGITGLFRRNSTRIDECDEALENISLEGSDTHNGQN